MSDTPALRRRSHRQAACLAHARRKFWNVHEAIKMAELRNWIYNPIAHLRAQQSRRGDPLLAVSMRCARG